MTALRFGILGGSPERVSRLGRLTIQRLGEAGCQLVRWIPGEPEAPLPWNLDDPKPLEVEVGKQAPEELDFLLQLDRSWPDETLLNSPRFGVWRFASPSPGPLAFWDVFDALYHMELRLDRLTPDPHKRISLGRRWLKVDRLSYHNTLSAAVEELARMPAHAIKAGLETLRQPVAFPPERECFPSAAERARLRFKLFTRFLRDQARGLFFFETWQLGLVEAPIERFLEFNELPPIRWLPSPGPRRFLADPFVAITNAGPLLMAEEYDFRTARGKIVCELAADGYLTGRVREAIQHDCHVSYPFLLRHEGQLYCIPETHEHGKTFAWRWDEAASKWAEPRLILDGTYVDCTPVCYGGRWWLFSTDKNDGVDSKLRIFYSDDLWGPWQPHARNPVKVDIRSARPGGSPFLYRGRLYRPAQDSSKHYGWRLALMRISRLTPTEFDEEVVRVVDCDLIGAEGIHTLSGDGALTLIDARRSRFMPERAPRLLAHKIARLFHGPDYS